MGRNDIPDTPRHDCTRSTVDALHDGIVWCSLPFLAEPVLGLAAIRGRVGAPDCVVEEIAFTRSILKIYERREVCWDCEEAFEACMKLRCRCWPFHLAKSFCCNAWRPNQIRSSPIDNLRRLFLDVRCEKRGNDG